ncbi:1-phosphofructokinase [Velocimicrobium porci]|uniref:Tagatose-6-phosphate kinase n=1 Tax=Velocimicrobium porci TaxID=2606634 RepID=A0A6L5XX15_9FIRM|nr:1-phosphofructokinase [Velocimicrobium porci]MSS63390.1 1-phosphofructokinase [Velocimicrobium porci]
MIYTVTFNPSLDYIVTVKEFCMGMVNRTERELIYPGGKGINVSLVLKNLGVESTALGFIAGFTGVEIERSLKELGCLTDFIKTKDGMSRINIKLRSKEETEINGRGPEISKEELSLLYKKLDKLNNDDILVLAGSIPASMPASSYEDIMKYLEKKEVKIVVDATKDLLVNVLKYHPFLIKPNNHELEEIFHEEVKTKEDVKRMAKQLQELGAINVLVSMAGDGAVLLSEDGIFYESLAPKGTVMNSVGAGDSMVAGFLTGYLKENDYKKAFYMGIATGSASAFSEKLATKDEVVSLLKQLS